MQGRKRDKRRINFEYNNCGGGAAQRKREKNCSWKTILPTNNMKPQQSRKQEMNSAQQHSRIYFFRLHPSTRLPGGVSQIYI